MKKPLAAFAGTVVTIFLVILLCQDFVLRIAFENKITQVTGFKAKIQDLHYQYPNAIHIQGLTLYNPPEFVNPVFAECTRLYMILNMPEFIRRENLHIYLLSMSIRAVHLEKTRADVSNLQLLKPVSSPSLPGLPFLLDVLELSLRNVDFLDMGSITPAKVSSSLRVEREQWGPIQDPNDIFGVMALKLYYETEFGKNLGIDPSQFQKE